MAQPTLRMTPRWMYGRDVTLFPEAQQAQREHGCPRHYSVWVTCSRVRFTFDMLFLPPDIEAKLHHLYSDYVEWWLAKGNLARRRFPSDSLPVSRPQDGVTVTVLREHGEWWLGLFRAILPFGYSPWRLEMAEHP
jgi:hypothetical protein